VKIYMASSWKNAEIVRQLAANLQEEGFEVDAFCRATDERYSFHWSELVDTEEELLQYDALTFLNDHRVQRAFNEDKRWLDWADTVIMVMPCGRSSHLEAGYAKGQGKRLYIYGDFQKGEFDVMYGFADMLFRSEEWGGLVTLLQHLDFAAEHGATLDGERRGRESRDLRPGEHRGPGSWQPGPGPRGLGGAPGLRDPRGVPGGRERLAPGAPT